MKVTYDNPPVKLNKSLIREILKIYDILEERTKKCKQEK